MITDYPAKTPCAKHRMRNLCETLCFNGLLASTQRCDPDEIYRCPQNRNRFIYCWASPWLRPHGRAVCPACNGTGPSACKVPAGCTSAWPRVAACRRCDAAHGTVGRGSGMTLGQRRASAPILSPPAASSAGRWRAVGLVQSPMGDRSTSPCVNRPGQSGNQASRGQVRVLGHVGDLAQARLAQKGRHGVSPVCDGRDKTGSAKACAVSRFT